MKTAWIGGGMGFIGHHLARRLKSEGYFVRVVDIKDYEHGSHDFADEYIIADLRDPLQVSRTLVDRYQEPFYESKNFDEVYCLACLMGGAGFVFTGDNDADIMHDSALINLNIVDTLKKNNFKGKVFYSSSACMYPQEIQNDIKPHINIGYSLKETDAYPANPDSEYGWEKLFSERLYLAYQRNYNLNVRIARFHNIYGPEGTYKGGKEKAPAAMCRKVVLCSTYGKDLLTPKGIEDGLTGNEIEVWGDGSQTRSFLYIDDCIDAVRLLMESEFKEPINIGSEEMVSINDLAKMAIELSGKSIKIKNIEGPTGVRGRNSDNTLIRKVLNWEPKFKLKEGLGLTYKWIYSQYGL